MNSAQHYLNTSYHNLELLRGSFTTRQFKPHFHECYTVILVEEGIGDYSNGNSRFIIPEGTFLVLNPYDVHSGRSANKLPWSFSTLYVPQEVMRNVGLVTNKYGYLPRFENQPIRNSSLLMLARKFFSEISENSNCWKSDLFHSVFLNTLIQDYAKFSTCDESINPSIHKVRAYLHENYLHQISLNGLCEIAGMSDYNLVKIFKNGFGLPPHQYLLNLRIERAKKILIGNKYSLTEVAYKSGFFDQSHFIRHFKTIVGITPKQYAGITR